MRRTWNIHFYLNIYCLIINQAWSNNNICLHQGDFGKITGVLFIHIYTFSTTSQTFLLCLSSLYIYIVCSWLFPHIFSYINIIPFTFFKLYVHPSSSLQRLGERQESAMVLYITQKAENLLIFYWIFVFVIFAEHLHLTYINRIKDQFSS